ncbi:hypothetical protein ACO0K9_13940 [Undibacterium sp. Ji50W]|uniref:hypothetical protein n=1 Tax=Undibacterium sp. Ji50W TaxID=3413041 RepID=UPI003BF39D64
MKVAKHHNHKWLGSLMMVMATGMLAVPAHAYRPFDGTDASVAEPGIFELELGPLGYVKNGTDRTLVVPSFVANFGFDGNTEIVLEGRINHLIAANDVRYQTSLGDTALSVKHLFRTGNLQDGGSGVSIAAECGVLLPEIHGVSGNGATCAGIISHRFNVATVHLNAALTRTRAQNAARFLGLIIEGDAEEKVRPVAETYIERDKSGGRTGSVLVGMIWKHSEDLSFDVALRRASSSGENISELRAGLTWSYAMHK